MRLFFTLLPQRTNWHQKAADPAEFIIDETFGVPGVGTVVAGAVPMLPHSDACSVAKPVQCLHTVTMGCSAIEVISYLSGFMSQGRLSTVPSSPAAL